MNNHNNNGKKLLDKITDLDPKLITDADKKPRTKSKLLIGITSGMSAVAAAALIAVAAGNIPPKVPPVVDSDPVISDSGSGSSDIVDSSSGSDLTQYLKKAPVRYHNGLPVISTGDYGTGAMGGEDKNAGGKRADLLSWELELASPWGGITLETMPVYMSGSTEIPDLDRMYARVKEIAAALGIPENELTITDSYERLSSDAIEYQIKMAQEMGAPQEEIDEVINRMIRGTTSSIWVEAKNDKVRITLFTSYAAQIHFFEEPVELPDEYNFSSDATAEEKGAALKYLAEKYKELTGYSKPAPGQPGSDGNYIYEADGDLTQQIVNYWINKTQFQVDKNSGKLDVIWIYSDGALEKLADYPILTPQQAAAVLRSDYEIPDGAEIVKTDIVYKNPPGATAVMPYYEFYIQSGEEPLDGYDLVCEVYTIAAVPEEYIDMETTDYGVRA